jgi:hypothetical protein
MSHNVQGNASSRGNQQFIKHLERASEIVKSWPQWKQGVLGQRVNAAPGQTGAQPSVPSKPAPRKG